MIKNVRTRFAHMPLGNNQSFLISISFGLKGRKEKEEKAVRGKRPREKWPQFCRIQN
jgi:hypothetical protein